MDLPLHPAHTSSTIEMNNDVWLLVLDYISTIRDLKSLCLTSKAFRNRATPRLYNKVLLRLWDELETKKFIRSVANGAGLLLEYTRTLVIEHVAPPPEPNSVAVGSWALGTGQWESALQSSQGRTLELILQMFPRDRLTSFQSIPPFPLRLETLLQLTKDQAQISHILLSAKNQRSFEWKSLHCFKNLRSLNLFMVDEDVLTLAVQALPGMDKLECLTLGQTIPGSSKKSYSQALIAGVNHIFADPNGFTSPMASSEKFLPRLKELSLQGLDLLILPFAISEILDVSKLSQLTLFNCTDVIPFFSAIGEIHGQQPLSLSHLCVQGRDVDSGRSLTPSEEEFWLGLIRAETLRNLHLSWMNGSRFGDFLQSNLRAAHGVRSLGVHIYNDLDDTDNEDEWENEDDLATFTPANLRELCIACPGIRALGLQFAEAYLSLDEWADSTVTQDSIACLQYLPELHILHLRQPNKLKITSSMANIKLPTFELQRFANAFFDILHTRNYCPKFEALVIGSWVYESEYDNYGCYRTQHCFVKGFQTDIIGRKIAIAVPVTRSVLRRVGQYTDILDFDPQCDRVGGLDGSNTR